MAMTEKQRKLMYRKSSDKYSGKQKRAGKVKRSRWATHSQWRLIDELLALEKHITENGKSAPCVSRKLLLTKEEDKLITEFLLSDPLNTYKKGA